MTSITPNFPVVTLQAIFDAKHTWQAVLITPQAELSFSAFITLLAENGLYANDHKLSYVLFCNSLNAFELDPASAQLLNTKIDRQRTFLLLPETKEFTPADIDAIKHLQESGFRFMAHASTAAQLPTIKISALACHGSSAVPHALSTENRQLSGPFLAYALNDSANLGAYQTAAYTWFSGDYPLHPISKPVTQGKGSSSVLLLKLLGLVSSEAEAAEIEKVLKQAPELSYQLLKLVNSVGFSANKRITSFNHAITLLGRRQLQRWLQLLLYAQQGGQASNPLLPRAAFRASLCEALCRSQGGEQSMQEHAFMVGMFSLLDILLGLPLSEILKPLNLADELVHALLQRQGQLGIYLTLAEYSEQAQNAAISKQLTALNLTPEAFFNFQTHALHWTIQISQNESS